MSSVLITNPAEPVLLRQMTRRLRAAGHEVRYHPAHPGWTAEMLMRLLPGVTAVIAGGDDYSARVIGAAPDLRLIVRIGVGHDLVDLDAATRAGVLVINTPGVATDAVADQTVGLLIAVVRGLVRQALDMKAGRYEPIVGHDLESMVLGLVGCGRIGGAVATRAQAFGMRVIAHDLQAATSGRLPLGVEAVDLDELLRRADVVSLHVPLTHASRGMVDDQFLGRMKAGSFLINTGRGGLVDDAALLRSLGSGHLAGAGLDCLGTEPPIGVTQRVVAHPAVVATPHSAGATEEAESRGAIGAVKAVVLALSGRRPPHVLNPEVATKDPFWPSPKQHGSRARSACSA